LSKRKIFNGYELLVGLQNADVGSSFKNYIYIYIGLSGEYFVFDMLFGPAVNKTN